MRTACHRLRGGDWGRARCTPHVADAQVGEIRGYARLPPPAGVAEMSAFCHHLRRRRCGCDTSRPRNQMQIPPIQWMINQPNRQRWDAIHIYIDTNIEKWNPHGVGAIAIGSDALLRNPKSLRILTVLWFKSLRILTVLRFKSLRILTVLRFKSLRILTFFM